MSRERFVDPRIWGSEQFCDVGRDARLLFIGLITIADDCGFASASPHRLKVTIFPTDNDVGRDEVSGMLSELMAVGLIIVLDVEGGPHLWIPSFFSWQCLKWRSRSRTLDAMVKAGYFTTNVDGKGRVTAASLNLPEAGRIIRGYDGAGESAPESAGVIHNVDNPAENQAFPERGGEARRGEGSDVRRERPNRGALPAVSLELPQNGSVAPAEPNNGNSAIEGTAKQRQTAIPAEPTATKEAPTLNDTPTSEPTRSIIESWLRRAEPPFAKAAQLRQIANLLDHNDPVVLLGHVREIDTDPDASSKPAMLWSRLQPGGKAVIPADKHVAWAKDQLGGAAPRGGPASSPADALQGMIDDRESQPQTPAEAFAMLSAGWSRPGETNHSAERESTRAMLAREPIDVLAYAITINSGPPKGDPWQRIAEMCASLPRPREKYRKMAEEMIANPREAGAG